MEGPYKDFFKAATAAKKGAGVSVKREPIKREKKTMGKKSKVSTPIKKREKRKSLSSFLPWKMITSMAIGLAITLTGYLNIEEIESFLDRLEVSGVTPVQAASTDSGETKASAKGQDQAKMTSGKKSVAGKTEENKASWNKEEVSHFSKLRDRKKELDLREEELNELEEELHKQKVEIEARIKKLEEIRAKIAGVLKERVSVDEEKVDKLVQFYSNMKPQQAAKIIATIDENLAVEVLGKMKKKNAAAIMNLLKSEKAQALSEKFAGYKRR